MRGISIRLTKYIFWGVRGFEAKCVHLTTVSVVVKSKDFTARNYKEFKA